VQSAIGFLQYRFQNVKATTSKGIITTKYLLVIINNNIRVGVIVWIKIGNKIINLMAVEGESFYPGHKG